MNSSTLKSSAIFFTTLSLLSILYEIFSQLYLEFIISALKKIRNFTFLLQRQITVSTVEALQKLRNCSFFRKSVSLYFSG